MVDVFGGLSVLFFMKKGLRKYLNKYNLNKNPKIVATFFQTSMRFKLNIWPRLTSGMKTQF